MQSIGKLVLLFGFLLIMFILYAEKDTDRGR